MRVTNNEIITTTAHGGHKELCNPTLLHVPLFISHVYIDFILIFWYIGFLLISI
jgi:hypothetical protein